MLSQTAPNEKTISSVLEKTGNNLKKVFRPITDKLCLISMVLVMLMVFGVSLDVFLKLFSISVPGIVEAISWMIVLLTFLSVAYVETIRGHINIDLILKKLSPKTQNVLRTINSILYITFVFIITWQLFKYGQRNADLTGVTLKIPIVWIIGISLIGLVVFLIILAGDLLVNLGTFLKQPSLVGWLAIIIVPVIIFLAPTWFGWLGLNKGLIGLVSILIMLALLFSGLPLSPCLGIAGFLATVSLTTLNSALRFAGTKSFSTTSTYHNAVIPFFIIMGSLIATSGIGAELFETMKIWAGRIKGSLAMAAILAGAAFAAVCGSNFAAAAAVGRISLPEMKKNNYPLSLAAGSSAAGGTLGVLIPPSVLFIIYAILTEQSITSLFIAGILPGILLALAMCVTSYFVALRFPEIKAAESYSLKVKIKSLKGVFPILFLFLLVIGGIYLGIFTPVQGGAIGTLGTFLFILATKRYTKKGTIDALLDAANMSGMLLFMFICVEFINSGLALSRIPLNLADYLISAQISDWMVFFLFILIFLVAGFFLNVVMVLLLTVPILLPTLVNMDVNLIWFGVVFVIVAMIGQLTPPIGVVCFVIKGLDEDLSLSTVYKGVTPYWITMIVFLAIIIAFPGITLFLENLLR